MVTETVVKKATPFNIDVARAELSQLNDSYAGKMTELVAAGANADVAKMQTLGAEMAAIAVKQERLTKRIARAENGSDGGNLEAKIAARKAAFDCLTNFFLTDESNAVRGLLAAAPTVKKIVIEIDNGMIQGFSTVGGFREVKVRGTKRPRARWQGGSITSDEGLTTKELVIAYGSKYGVTKAYADLTSSERNAAAVTIAAGEGAVNLNARSAVTEMPVAAE